MKWMILLVVLVSVQALVCDKGCEPYQGVCVCDQKPESAPVIDIASDEKPSRHPQPAYQRGDVVADMPVSLASEDAKLDQEKAKATEEGRKAAGIN